jgi:peroxiredoxin
MTQKLSGFSIFLCATSIALAALVVVLSSQNRALKRALAHESVVRADQAEARFVPGEIVPPLSLLARDGGVETLDFAGDGGRTLLMFYAETCNVCPQVFLSWEQLLPQFTSDGVRVAAVQLDRTGTSAPYGPPGVESFALADFSRVPLAKVATVPLTLLLDERGTVLSAHYGTLTEKDMGALIAFLPATK